MLAYTGGKKISDSSQVPVDFGSATANVEQVTENGFQDGLFNRAANKSIDPADVANGPSSALFMNFLSGKGKLWSPSNGLV